MNKSQLIEALAKAEEIPLNKAEKSKKAPSSEGLFCTRTLLPSYKEALTLVSGRAGSATSSKYGRKTSSSKRSIKPPHWVHRAV